MAIVAENKGGGNYTPIEAGTYMARCYSMVHIGTVEQTWEGKTKTLNKVRLTWELPTELKEFKEGEGEKPYVISQDFTLSMHEKANLRKTLESWRGRAFQEEEAKQFDITKLLGVECMISVIHKESNGSTYANISSIVRLIKGSICPPQINANFEFSYDQKPEMLATKIETLPDFLKDKIRATPEWKSLHITNTENINEVETFEDADDLPF